MGLFSFVKKAVRGVAKVVGSVVKPKNLLRAAAAVATGGTSEAVIRGVNLAKNVAKLAIRHPDIQRGADYLRGTRSEGWLMRPKPSGNAIIDAKALGGRMPVLMSPGLASRLSTPYNTPGPHQNPGGRKRGGLFSGAIAKRRAKRKASSSKRGKRSKGRLPKFGSPAWRKRFGLDKRRRRRRAA